MTDWRRRDEYLRRVRALHSTTITGVPSDGPVNRFHRIYHLLLGALVGNQELREEFAVEPPVTFAGVLAVLRETGSGDVAEELNGMRTNTRAALLFIDYLLEPGNNVARVVAEFVASHLTSTFGVLPRDVLAVLNAEAVAGSATRLLRLATQFDIPSLVRKLVERGASINDRAFGDSAATIAAAADNTDIVGYFLRQRSITRVTTIEQLIAAAAANRRFTLLRTIFGRIERADLPVAICLEEAINNTGRAPDIRFELILGYLSKAINRDVMGGTLDIWKGLTAMENAAINIELEGALRRS